MSLLLFWKGSSGMPRARFICSGRFDAIDVADVSLRLLVKAFPMRLCILNLILKNRSMLFSLLKLYVLLNGPVLSF